MLEFEGFHTYGVSSCQPSIQPNIHPNIIAQRPSESFTKPRTSEAGARAAKAAAIAHLNAPLGRRYASLVHGMRV